METSIADFRTKFYIPEIQKLAFNLPHVCILGTQHCGKERREAFKHRGSSQDLLCWRDCAERVVASSANKIQSEYYGGNRAVSVEGIELDHFRESQQSQAFYGPSSPTSHAVFHTFLSDNSKHDADTTAAHSKHIIELF